MFEMYVFISCLYVCLQALNPDNEYHFKNRMKACQRNWAEVFGEEANMFAVSLGNTYQKVRGLYLYSTFTMKCSYCPDALESM